MTTPPAPRRGKRLLDLALGALLLCAVAWGVVLGRSALRRTLEGEPVVHAPRATDVPAPGRPPVEAERLFSGAPGLPGVRYGMPFGGQGLGFAMREGRGGPDLGALLDALAREDGLDTAALAAIGTSPTGVVRRTLSRFGGVVWFPGGAAYYRLGVEPMAGDLRLVRSRVVLLYDCGDETQVVEVRFPDGFDLRRTLEDLVPARPEVEHDGLPWDATGRPLLRLAQQGDERLYVYRVEGDPAGWADGSLRRCGWTMTASGPVEGSQWTRGKSRVFVLHCSAREGVLVLARGRAAG